MTPAGLAPGGATVLDQPTASVARLHALPRDSVGASVAVDKNIVVINSDDATAGRAKVACSEGLPPGPPVGWRPCAGSIMRRGIMRSVLAIGLMVTLVSAPALTQSTAGATTPVRPAGSELMFSPAPPFSPEETIDWLSKQAADALARCDEASFNLWKAGLQSMVEWVYHQLYLSYYRTPNSLRDGQLSSSWHRYWTEVKDWTYVAPVPCPPATTPGQALLVPLPDQPALQPRTFQPDNDFKFVTGPTSQGQMATSPLTPFIPGFSIKVATDGTKFCTYGDGTGTPVSIPLGTGPQIASGPSAAPPSTTRPSPPSPSSTPKTYHGGPDSAAGPLPPPTPVTQAPPGGPNVATAPKDCRVCGEAWPAGHATAADCPTCGMAGSTAPDVPVCEHCGVDKPAGQSADTACTTCNDGKPERREASPDCVVCGDKWPAGVASTADCPTCGMDGGQKPAGSDRLCEHCGVTNPVGHSPGAPCTTCGEQSASTPPAATPAAPGNTQVATTPALGNAQIPATTMPNWRPTAHDAQGRPVEHPESGVVYQDVNGDKFSIDRDGNPQWPPAADAKVASGSTTTPSTSAATQPSGTQTPAATTQTPGTPSAPQEIQITVTIVFKANMAKVQEGQAALTSLPEAQLGKLLADVPAAPGPTGTASTQAAQNAGAADDPSLCKSGADGACKVTVSRPLVDAQGRRIVFHRGHPVTYFAGKAVPAIDENGHFILRDADGRPFILDGQGRPVWYRPDFYGTPLPRLGTPATAPTQPTAQTPGSGPSADAVATRTPGSGQTPGIERPLDTIQSDSLHASLDMSVSQTSGGVVETTGNNTKPDLSLPAGTPAGVNVTGTPFTSGDGRTYVRLAFSQPFGLNFPFDQFFQKRFGDNYKVDFCFDEAPMGSHAIASSVLNSELPAAAVKLRLSSRPRSNRR